MQYQGLDLDALSSMVNYQRWIMDSFLPHITGRTLEVGAGIGTFSEFIFPAVTGLDLLEPATNLAKRLDEKYGGLDTVKLHRSTLESFLDTDDKPLFDTVVMINVMEHIKDDFEALSKLSKITVDNGHILIFVPAIPWLYSNLDAQLGHFRRYTKPSLLEVVSRAGFTVSSCRYFDLAGVLLWWIIHKIAKKTSFNPRLVKYYDLVVIPILKRAESVIEPIIGKNLILVAKKEPIQ